MFEYENKISAESIKYKKEDINFDMFFSKYKQKLDSYIKTTQIIMSLEPQNVDEIIKKKDLKIPINLQEEFSEIFVYKYSLILYEFINILLAMVEKKLVFELNKFFLVLKKDIFSSFYKVPILFPDSVLLIKNYFKFLFSYRSIAKNSRVILIFSFFSLINIFLVFLLYFSFIINKLFYRI